jgi:hypothetical protein
MKIPLLLALVALATSSLHATSINLSNEPQGRSVLDSDGFTLADGSLVLVGTFLNISTLANLPPVDLANAAGWTQFGNSLAIGSAFGNGGKLIGTSNDLSSTADAFNGETIYLWVFNAPTIEASTQYGVFTATAGVPSWAYPTNNGGIGDILTISADDASLVAVSGLGTVDASHLQLVAFSSIPEPSYGIIGLGALLLCVQRYRERRRAS